MEQFLSEVLKAIQEDLKECEKMQQELQQKEVVLKEIQASLAGLHRVLNEQSESEKAISDGAEKLKIQVQNLQEQIEQLTQDKMQLLKQLVG